jgi:hypothetical protein
VIAELIDVRRGESAQRVGVKQKVFFFSIDNVRVAF